MVIHYEEALYQVYSTFTVEWKRVERLSNRSRFVVVTTALVVVVVAAAAARAVQYSSMRDYLCVCVCVCVQYIAGNAG